MVRSIGVLFLVSAIAALLSLEVAALSYPYAEFTPGTTSWNQGGNQHVPNAATVGAMHLDVDRVIPDHGQDKSGNPFDCRTIIRTISAAIPAFTDLTAKAYVTGTVIGVALVDIGTVGNSDVRAFYAPSGPTFALDATAEGNSKTWLATQTPSVNTANRWNIIRTTSPYTTDSLMRHRRGLVVQDLGVTPAGTWSGIAPVNTATPEGIQFAVDAGRTTIYKKWPGAGGTFTDSSSNIGGTCALQKLTTALYGFNGPLPFAHLTAGAQRNNGAGGRLICAAESSFAGKIRVKTWTSNAFTDGGANPANDVGVYRRHVEVASCVVCQAVIPEVVGGSFVGCHVPSLLAALKTQNNLPNSFTQGNCPTWLSPFGGASCQLTYSTQGVCATGRNLAPVTTVTCVDGALHLANVASLTFCGRGCGTVAATSTLTLGSGNTSCRGKNLKHGESCQQGSKNGKPLLGGSGVGHLTECIDGTLTQPHTFIQTESNMKLKQKLRRQTQTQIQIQPAATALEPLTQ